MEGGLPNNGMQAAFDFLRLQPHEARRWVPRSDVRIGVNIRAIRRGRPATQSTDDRGRYDAVQQWMMAMGEPKGSCVVCVGP